MCDAQVKLGIEKEPKGVEEEPGGVGGWDA